MKAGLGVDFEDDDKSKLSCPYGDSTHNFKTIKGTSFNNSLTRDRNWRYSQYINSDELTSGGKTEVKDPNKETLTDSEREAMMNLFKDMNMDSNMAKEVIEQLKQKKEIMIAVEEEDDPFDGDERAGSDDELKNADLNFGDTIFGGGGSSFTASFKK